LNAQTEMTSARMTIASNAKQAAATTAAACESRSIPFRIRCKVNDVAVLLAHFFAVGGDDLFSLGARLVDEGLPHGLGGFEKLSAKLVRGLGDLDVVVGERLQFLFIFGPTDVPELTFHFGGELLDRLLMLWRKGVPGIEIDVHHVGGGLPVEAVHEAEKFPELTVDTGRTRRGDTFDRTRGQRRHHLAPGHLTGCAAKGVHIVEAVLVDHAELQAHQG